MLEIFRTRACSYDPACRDVSPGGTDISMRSHGVFHPACRDEILLLALAKDVHFSHATQLFSVKLNGKTRNSFLANLEIGK